MIRDRTTAVETAIHDPALRFPNELSTDTSASTLARNNQAADLSVNARCEMVNDTDVYPANYGVFKACDEDGVVCSSDGVFDSLLEDAGVNGIAKLRA